MIEHLFVSKVRMKLLKMFFLDISQEIHIRGIVRKLGEEINAIRRELKNLQEASILLAEHRGNRVYYKVNPESPLFSDMLSLVHKEYGLGGALIRNKAQLGDVKYGLLTVMFLENQHPSQYDVDVMLVGNVNMKEVSAAIKTAENELQREIRYTVLSEQELDFRKKKRDSFVTNIIYRQKVMLFGNENLLMS